MASFSSRLSFYSGHSSFSMYCMLFVAVSALRVHGGAVWAARTECHRNQDQPTQPISHSVHLG